MSPDQHQPGPASEGGELNLLPPPGLFVPLWRSLLANLRDCFSPERLPPLKLSSRSVDVGMLVGDKLDRPWYRTLLTGIHDLVSPEHLPPLQLESQPVDVELISDLPAWWRSLLRNLADALAPERQPTLRLTSRPMNPEMASTVLLAPRWSALIDTPKWVSPDSWKTTAARPLTVAAPMRTTFLQLSLLEPDTSDGVEQQLVAQMKRSLRRAHLRELIWLSVVVAEVIAIVVLRMIQR